jgi:S-adenosylmethionine:tRNA ribosyltransferase-isomerase
MRTECLNYDLPGELIAQRPTDVRGESRLLVMERARGRVFDRHFADIIEYIRGGDCVVLNNTKVLAAKFFGHRKTGARLEGLLLGERTTGLWEVMVKGAGKVKVGERMVLCDKDGRDWQEAKAVERTDDGRWLLKVDSGEDSAHEVLDKIGFAPLPPYIKRSDDKELTQMDLQRYQTVYAQKAGAVAAPTAGLHFTGQLFERLKNKGVRVAYVTLHVGAGTFKPIKAENLAEHEMHAERFRLCAEDAEVINETTDRGGRIIAVGTTSVRTLEAICREGKVEPAEGTTSLFITPGYEFKIIDAMITNFHLPRSTLLALVCAFGELENVLAAYRHAIEQRYRFYSYGDAMLIA